MSILIAAAIIALTATGDEAASTAAEPAAAAGDPAAPSASDTQALAAAKPFLSRLDAGDWKGSWKAAGPMFRSAATADEWAANVEPVRAPLGKVETRRFVTANLVSSLPGAPDGDYQVLQYQTVFSGRSGVLTETVILARDPRGDSWGVAGYFVT